MDDDDIPIKQDGKWTVSLLDYVVHNGQRYELVHNDFTDEMYLTKVDEIPEEYWERWDDE